MFIVLTLEQSQKTACVQILTPIVTSRVPISNPGSSVSKESACSAGDAGSIPGPGRSPGEGNGKPRQYSCLDMSILAWEIPWTEKPGRSLKVRHDLVSKQYQQGSTLRLRRVKPLTQGRPGGNQELEFYPSSVNPPARTPEHQARVT